MNWTPIRLTAALLAVLATACADGAPPAAPPEALTATTAEASLIECTTAADCDDGLPCTIDRCSKGACVNTQVGDAACCNTANDCATDAPCTTMACVQTSKGYPVCRASHTPGCCTTDGQCDDRDACTADLCVEESCANTPIEGCCKTTADCDDGNPCNVDRCSDHQCKHSGDVIAGCCNSDEQCADKNICTTDACDLATNTCTHAAKDPGDGLICCTTAADCDDGSACTTDTCRSSGVCRNDLAHALGCCEADTDCSDSEYCASTPVHTCTAKLPAGEACESAAWCADGACDGGLCASHCDPNPCQNGGACTTTPDAYTCECPSGTTGDTCAFWDCNVLDCDDGNACTTDNCRSDIGCESVLLSCDDGVACTVDSCDTEEGCSNAPNDAACSDDVACTADVCVAGVGCTYMPEDSACDDDVACTVDVCDAVTGCVITPDDAACDDGFACTVDSCDALAGCSSDPSDALCDDGNAGTTDSCFQGTTCPSGAYAGSSCYETFQGDILWKDANSACEALGGHLASIADQTDQDTITGVIVSGCTGDAWVGGNDIEVEGTFVWTDGTPFTFTNWYGGNGPPSGASDADAIKLHYVAGTWFNLRTDLVASCYVCEFAPIFECGHVELTGEACDDGNACTEAAWATPTPSASSCDELGWTNAATNGSPDVCGETDAAPLTDCSGMVSFDDAAAFCEAAGARLCNINELWLNESKGTGCSYDSLAIWSSSPCDGGHWTAPGDAAKTGIPHLCAGDTELRPARCCADVAPAAVTTQCVPTGGGCADGSCTAGICQPETGCEDAPIDARCLAAVDSGTCTGAPDCHACVNAHDSFCDTGWDKFCGACARGGGGYESACQDSACAAVCGADATACASDAVCSSLGVCLDGACTVEGDTCDDDDPCTTDTCTEVGCVNADCDGNSCTYNECSWSCDAGSQIGGSCFEAVSGTNTWADAGTACEAAGGRLAVIGSQATNDSLRALADDACGSTGAWIGLSDAANEGLFVWPTGNSPAYTNWSSNEPNNGDSSGEDFVVLTTDGTWNDAATSSTQDCAICEFVPAPSCSASYTESDCCLVPEGGNQAGCSDTTCESCVCGADPYCCNTSWDSSCRDCADGGPGNGDACLGSSCGAECGCTPTYSPYAADCCTGTGVAGCSNAACEYCVGKKDSYCINVAWDGNCAECASGGAGSKDNCYDACTAACMCDGSCPNN